MNKKAFLHLLNEFAPVMVFFISAQFYSFYVATGSFMVATLLALLTGWIAERRLPLFPIISGVFVISSGLITIFYHKPDALIFADSLYYFLMALISVVGLHYNINILKRIFENTFAMHDQGWHILTMRWIMIFIAAGIANELARAFLTPEEWVNFKVLKVLTVALFGFYQFTLARRYRLPEATSWGLRR